MIDDAPLIVSLGVDAVSFDRFDGLRRAHFPKGLNKIPAHLTVFHHLPGERLSDVQKVLADAATTRTPFVMAVTGLRKLGRGVALTLASPELQTVRAGIAARFADVLTPQDRQAFRPHVTIQNKVDPKAALTSARRDGCGFRALESSGRGASALALPGRPVGSGRPIRVQARGVNFLMMPE